MVIKMTIKEIETYYRNMADGYAREALELRHKAEDCESIKDFDKAIAWYTLSAENFKKSRLCTDFVNKLVEMEILEACK